MSTIPKSASAELSLAWNALGPLGLVDSVFNHISIALDRSGILRIAKVIPSLVQVIELRAYRRNQGLVVQNAISHL
jgi:hypothetical protein